MTRLRRGCLLVIAVASGVLALAPAAAAHVEVSAEPARALAADAVLTFDAEAESDSAGIVEIRVVLPSGVAPGDVSFVAGPNGWTFAATADGYAVSGPVLPVGTSAQHQIKVRQLPNSTSLVFKTLQTYSDGRVDRWIEVPAPGQFVEHPAPTLQLSPADAGATTVSSPATAPAESGPTVSAAAAPPATPASGRGGGAPVGILLAMAAAAALIVGGFWWLRQRRDAVS